MLFRSVGFKFWPSEISANIIIVWFGILLFPFISIDLITSAKDVFVKINIKIKKLGLYYNICETFDLIHFLSLFLNVHIDLI